MKKLVYILLLTMLAPAKAFAGDISITEVEVMGNTARVVINGVLEIKEIELKDGDMIFPRYISQSGKVFPQVKFLTQAAKQVVADAVMNKKPSKETVKKINYKVTKMSPYSKEGSSLKAFAAVTFNGVVEVECKMMKSSKEEGEYWIAWPARPPDRNKGEKRWVDQITIVNKKVREIVEKELKDKAKNASSGGTMMTETDVDIMSGLVNAPVTVTAVKVRKMEGNGPIALAEVDINYSFRISDIEVYQKDKEIFLKFPVYMSPQGKEYEQMKIFSRKLRAEIRECIRTGKPSKDPSNKLGFEITKFEAFGKEDSSLKCFCAVTLNGAIEVECKILDSSKYKPFVGWPSSQEGGAYADKMVPCNKEVKEVIEKALLDRYREESGAKK
ncbi:MAG: septation protein SpoVG family protein [Elusimicrobiota bacterium]